MKLACVAWRFLSKLSALRGGPLEIPGGVVTIPKKKNPARDIFPKKIRASKVR